MRTIVGVLLGLLASTVHAQGAVVPTQADLQAAATAASAAAAAANAASNAVCTDPPLQDQQTATAGVASPCMPRKDAARKSVIQVSYATTAADGTFSGPVTGDYNFTVQPSYVDAKINSSSMPYLCGIGVWTATTYSGKCFQLIATTLPNVVTSIFNLTISPFSGTVAGLTVRVVARQ